MFDHKHVYVSLLKHNCLKVKHVSVSCFYSVELIPKCVLKTAVEIAPNSHVTRENDNELLCNIIILLPC